MSRPAPIIVLVPRPARWPWLEQRLTHEVEKAARGNSRLNEESLAIAHLYQHATTATRDRLYDFLRDNGCECLGCKEQRAFGERCGLGMHQ